MTGFQQVKQRFSHLTFVFHKITAEVIHLKCFAWQKWQILKMRSRVANPSVLCIF